VSTRPAHAGGLTPSAVRALARRHGIRPRKGLGQHFLIEPTLARRIVALAGVGPGHHVVEVGPGLGSLTVALASAGARVLAVEIDPRLADATRDAAGPWGDRVEVIEADAVTVDWSSALGDPGPWAVVANLPYNVSVPVVLRLLEGEPRVAPLLVMVQREVGERLAAAPGEPHYGAVSVRVAYWARARVLRRVSRSVFWPEPNVDSVLVLIERRPPPPGVDRERLFELIGVSFGQRRKTMRNALLRLGLDPDNARDALRRADISPMSRPEALGLDEFVRLARALPHGARS
jgi:16S rRNA (adenine1518-N6/adenine1519-N6)-dimethyltransferase